MCLHLSMMMAEADDAPVVGVCRKAGNAMFPEWLVVLEPQGEDKVRNPSSLS
jgi:hypothetical protein